jgi:Fe-S-cluster containining protein
MGFPCVNCGLCCKNVGAVINAKHLAKNPLVKKALDEFPYNTDESGACEMLTASGCSVYETRPDICNIDTMARLQGIPLNEYYLASAQSCNIMMAMDGLDESSFIVINE